MEYSMSFKASYHLYLTSKGSRSWKW